MTLRGRLSGPLLDVDTLVKVTVGAQDNEATEGTDYAAIDEVTLTIPAGRRRGRTEFVLNPIDDPIDEAPESLSLVGTTEGAGLRVDGTSLTITDDDERGVAVSAASLTVPEGRSSTYTLVLESEPTGPVAVTPSVGGDAGVTLSPPSLSFTADNWNEPQTVTVEAAGDEDTEDGTASVTHSVSGADYDAEPAASVELTVTDSGNPSTRVLLSVDMGSIAEAAGATDVEVTAQLDRGSLEEETQVSVSVGAATDTAVAGTDYAAVDDLTVIIPASEVLATAIFTLEPTDDSLTEPDEAITVSGSLDGSDLSVTATTITIRDDDALNNAPVFPTDLPGVLEVQENTAAGTAIGAPFLATDVDGDTLSYALEGIDASRFSIDPESGQLSTLSTLDHETQTRHSLTVWADDGHGGRAESVVRVEVTDLDEQPDTPAAPTMLATPDTTASLDLRWNAPHRGGGPDIVGYKLQYREGATGTWIDHRHIGAETRATISGLTEATDYQARVQALNGELPGDWSEPGEGATGRADNDAPEFDADLPATLTVDENTTADTDLGTPFRATDGDSDTLTFLLEGPDRHAFAIDSETGQLSTKASLDHESKATYSLKLRADDGRGGADTFALTVRV
ncbi:MAG: cadherin domain-containing protein, partial [Chloroflexi bacterium]|nr:cadherin domain-containing protein [Chloroflexota bacterium]